MRSGWKEVRGKRWIGFRDAFRGFKKVAASERNFQIHLVAAVLVILAAFLLHASAIEWVLLLTIITIVLSLEMMNSSIERAMDYLAPEFQPLVGAVKDVAAGAVLVASFFSVIIGLIIFLPKIINLF